MGEVRVWEGLEWRAADLEGRGAHGHHSLCGVSQTMAQESLAEVAVERAREVGGRTVTPEKCGRAGFCRVRSSRARKNAPKGRGKRRKMVVRINIAFFSPTFWSVFVFDEGDTEERKSLKGGETNFRRTRLRA